MPCSRIFFQGVRKLGRDGNGSMREILRVSTEHMLYLRFFRGARAGDEAKTAERFVCGSFYLLRINLAHVVFACCCFVGGARAQDETIISRLFLFFGFLYLLELTVLRVSFFRGCASWERGEKCSVLFFFLFWVPFTY